MKLILETRGLAPKTHHLPITDPVKAGKDVLLFAEQEFRWDCRGGLSWAAQRELSC